MSNVTAFQSASSAKFPPLMTKIEMTELIMAAKTAKGVTWTQIAETVGLSEVFVTSVALGQNSLEKAEADKLAGYLDLDGTVATCLTLCPKKGQEAEAVSKDPCIYRLFEIAYSYGDVFKELVHEKFGDGIMSAIDFDMYVDRVEDPKGDRVKVTMSGKFLPYKKW